MATQNDIPSLAKGLNVYKEIVNFGPGLTLNDLHNKFSIPKSTLLRIMTTLIAEGFLVKDGDTFVIGPIGTQLSLKVQSKMILKDIAQPYLKKLSAVTKETSHLIELQNNRGLIVAVEDGPGHIRISSRPGTLTLLHTSAPGKILLAHKIGPDNVKNYFNSELLEKRTDKSITTYDGLRTELSLALEQGYAVDNMEFYDDVRCIAAPVFDPHNEVIASIGITAPLVNLDDIQLKKTSIIVMEIAKELSEKLGHSKKNSI